ncbi:MAG: nickel-dependent lactate racemase [Anaerolineales bacterium]|nr:nickel-dependent lactate racemase [Anaerolineales bacterium]
MAEFDLPYGKSHLTFHLPDEIAVQVIAPPEVGAAENPLSLVETALEQPLGVAGLDSFIGARSVAIAINDKTRPVPHDLLLPPLLRRLEELGIPPDRISLLIATGTHPVMPAEEYSQIIPMEIIQRYPVFCHDAKDQSSLVFLGQTSRGTPVWVNRQYLKADVRIVVGNIEPHQFQGFSGGVKSAAIGLAGQITVNCNHAMMTDPNSRLGFYEGNPAREDVEEIGQYIGVHLALNAILNEHKQIVHVLAGEPRQVMKAGIPLARQICQVPVEGLFDLVIASPGGHPKDINIYQAQKGLAHAALVTRPGGTVILAAACPEGSGSQSYEAWMRDIHSYEQVFTRFQQEGYRVGPHKAFQIARDAARVRLQFFSDMDMDFARALLLNPINNLQSAIDQAVQALTRTGRVGILPRASSTIPQVH